VTSHSAPAACVIEGARQTAPRTARVHAGDLGLEEVSSALKNVLEMRSEECTRVR
jgi:hypothetical protein